MLIAELAHWMALLPLVAVAGLEVVRPGVPRLWWGLAFAFAVSWGADTAAHYVDAVSVSRVYPVAQFGLVYALLAPPRLALLLLAAMTTATLASVGLGTDVEAFGRLLGAAFVVTLAFEYRSPMTPALVVYFGLGALLWLLFVFTRRSAVFVPHVWYAYQACRLAGLLLFVQGLRHARPARVVAV